MVFVSYDRTGNILTADYAGEQTETNTYNELGLLTTVTTAEGDTLYQYDDASRLLSVTQPNGETVSYTYDSHGNRATMTYPNGKTVKYTYDDMNRLVSVKGVDGETTKYSYDALGRRIATDGAKEDTVYAYDEVGNLVSQTTTGAYDLALEYAYDLSGRMTQESRTEDGATLESVFTYDPLGQLTSFTRSDGQSEAYTYDPVGNMTAKTQNGVSTAMRYNAANQLISSVTGNDTTKYTYDANGNLTRSENAGGARSYAYNALNLLESFTREDGYTETYSYNANRLLSEIRTSEDLTTTLTWDILYGDGVVIGAAQNGQQTSYTHGLERISAQTGNTRTEYVYDGRGSVAAEVSYNNAWYTFGGGVARKNVTSKIYTPFGEQIGEAVSGFGYNGEYYNAATGMIYLRARFYAPEMNRFEQKDLLRGSIADGISLNRYLYCQSDPVNFADYNGLQMVAVCMSDGGGGGGKKTTTSSSGSTTPRVYTNTSQPKVYSNSYQEYQDQRRNAVTPNPQEYAMLRQTGYSGNFSQYASDKFHTQFPSYPEYMQGKAMGNPYYVTYNNGKPTPVAYQRTFYTNNQSNNTTSGISRDAPEVYDVTGGQYSCGRDINALGAGDYGADSLGATWNRIVDWARSDKGQKALLTTLSVLEIAGGVAITIATGGAGGLLLAGVSGALVGGGFGSLISGYATEAMGGNFTTGWVAGELSGTITGFGVGTGGLIFSTMALQSGASAAQAAGSVFALGVSSGTGGFIGGFASSAYVQQQTTGDVNLNVAAQNGFVSGAIAAVSWPFTAVSSAFGNAGYIGVASTVSFTEELIFDYSSFYAGQSLEVVP